MSPVWFIFNFRKLERISIFFLFFFFICVVIKRKYQYTIQITGSGTGFEIKGSDYILYKQPEDSQWLRYLFLL